MSIIKLIFESILYPFVLLISSVFEFAYSICGNYGVSLILLSFFITLVTAPLYYFAEKWKNQEKKAQKKMHNDIQSINANFEGQKRFYLTKTARKIYKYKWWYSFRTSLGLIIQIPFFFAAYEVLSKYTGYQGVSFLFVNDLSKPDMLFAGMNILPFIMTIVNVAYSIYYTKSVKWKANKDLYILAGVFLVLLYNSPAALLIYWTMNNVFSFVKGVILRKAGLSEVPIILENKNAKPAIEILKENLNVLYFFFFILACSLQVYSFLQDSMRYKYIILGLFIIAVVVNLIAIFKNKTKQVFLKSVLLWLIYLPILYIFLFTVRTNKYISDYNIKFMAGFYATFIIYIVLKYWIFKFKLNIKPLKHNIAIVFFTIFWVFFYLPILYRINNPEIVHVPFWNYFLTLLIPAFISFSILIILNYILKGKIKNIYNTINIFIILICLTYSLILKINIGELDFFTLKNFGNISDLPLKYYILDAFVLSILLYISIYILKKKRKLFINLSIILPVLLSITLLFNYLGKAKNADYISMPDNIANGELSELTYNQYVFSKNKTNVVCVLLDMFNGNYVQRIIEADSEYSNKLEGFTWYSDCLSVSVSTIRSIAGLLGGHEFIKDSIAVKDYHEVNAKAIDYFFQNIYNSGYNIIISPSGDYGGVDMSNYYIVNDAELCPHWKKQNGYGDIKKSNANISVLLMLSILQSSPNYLKYSIYDKEQWLFFHKAGKISALREETINRIAALDLLNKISSVKNTEKGNCIYIHSNLPHCPYAINESGNIMEANEFYDFSYSSFNNKDLALYASKLSLDILIKWLEWMKKNDVYDNTVIYFFSDHGNVFYDSDIPVSKKLNCSNLKENLSAANSLMLIKGLNSKGKLKIDSSYISSADLHAMLVSDANLNSIQDIDPRKQSYEENKKRIRTFFGPDAYFLGKNVYQVTGSMFDTKSWSLAETGKQ